MKYFALYALALLFLFSCSGSKKESKVSEILPIPIVNFDGIKPLFNKTNDTTYVINFWATWCAPCVKEISYFERIGEEFADKKVKIILINLDLPNHYESRLLPFVEEKGIKSKIIVLDDHDANRWINLVDPRWSGAIPATVIYNKNKRDFFEKEFTYEELEKVIRSFTD